MFLTYKKVGPRRLCRGLGLVDRGCVSRVDVSASGPAGGVQAAPTLARSKLCSSGLWLLRVDERADR